MAAAISFFLNLARFGATINSTARQSVNAKLIRALGRAYRCFYKRIGTRENWSMRNVEYQFAEVYFQQPEPSTATGARATHSSEDQSKNHP
jgi:hypothetical protein